MSTRHRRDAGYIAPAFPVLDQTWDADLAIYESAIVERCLRGETIEPSPDTIGVHDNDGVLSDEPGPGGRQFSWPKMFDSGIKAEFCEPIPPPKTNYYPMVRAFPHSTEDIAVQTIQNWDSVGEEDAARRGITADEWLWKRSRFLAGFR